MRHPPHPAGALPSETTWERDQEGDREDAGGPEDTLGIPASCGLKPTRQPSPRALRGTGMEAEGTREKRGRAPPLGSG